MSTAWRRWHEMKKEPDWLARWTRLVDMQRHWRQRRPPQDAWAGAAEEYRLRVKRKWQHPDSSRRIVSSWLGPGVSILDIGSGSGSWAALFAGTGADVTAVEPSQAMRQVLLRTLAEEGASRVRVVSSPWPQARVPRHDVVFCSHAMYSSSDFRAFVEAMERTAIRRCALLIRVPVHGGPMWEAAGLVLGHPHDSPNFIVAYNALLQMGIVANVRVEDAGPRGAWTHATLDDALLDVKGRLCLEPGPSPYDADLMAVLRRHLVLVDGRWQWPPTVRSALLWWEVGKHRS